MKNPFRSSQTLLAHDELFLQPWFLPKPTYLALRKLLPSSQLVKMRYYFEDYGCLKCESRTALYASNGLCKACSIAVRGRVALSLRRRFRNVGTKSDREAVDRYVGRMRDSATHRQLPGLSPRPRVRQESDH